jgi:hypothetical protein
MLTATVAKYTSTLADLSQLEPLRRQLRFFGTLWDGVAIVPATLLPLLLERVAGPFYTVYVVRAIGQGFPVAINSSPQTIPFNIVEGVTRTPNAEFTFGYVNALVNTSGQEVMSSSGTVDMDYLADSGPGVGGPRTLNN